MARWDPRRKETLSPNFYIEELHRANSPFMVLRPVNKLEHYIDAQSTILLSLTEVPVARIYNNLLLPQPTLCFPLPYFCCKLQEAKQAHC